MNLLLIGAQLSSMPYATRVDGGDVNEALRTAEAMEDETGYRP